MKIASSAQHLRQKALDLAVAIRSQDNQAWDRDPRPDRVDLPRVELSVPHQDGTEDLLYSARARFREGKPVFMKAESQHRGAGMPADYRVEMKSQGGLDRYKIRYDGYHGCNDYRADLVFRGDQCIESSVRPGPPRGLEALREIATDPLQVGMTLGVGTAAGLLSGALLGASSLGYLATTAISMGMMLGCAYSLKAYPEG